MSETNEIEMYHVPCQNDPSDFPCHDCGSFGACKYTKPVCVGMSLTEMKQHEQTANEKRPFGRTWMELAVKQGAPIR